MGSYRETLSSLRRHFPSPVVDKAHDRYFAETIMDAVARLQALKTGDGIYAGASEVDYEAARRAELHNEGISTEEANDLLLSYCGGSFIAGHAQDQRNVDPVPTISSLVGALYASILTANLAWDEFSQLLAQAEVECVAMLSRLVGYDPLQSGGFSTFGGSGSLLYAARIGLEKAIHLAYINGIKGENVVTLASEEAHWGCRNATGLIGIGRQNCLDVSTDANGSMRIDELRVKLRELLRREEKVATIFAAVGSTNTFAFDNLAEIVQVRDEVVQEFSLPYNIHVHADAVIGWVWSVFSDYDFSTNTLGFQAKTLTMLQQAVESVRYLHLADSIGFDFHKLGFAPYISTFIICKEEKDLQLLSREEDSMSIVYQFGKYRPGTYTIETSRSGGGVMSALATMKVLGKHGYRVLIGHLVEMTHLLRERLARTEGIEILNTGNVGAVTLIRFLPRYL